MDGEIMKKVAVGQLKSLRQRTSPVCRRAMNYSARARLFQAFVWKYPLFTLFLRLVIRIAQWIGMQHHDCSDNRSRQIPLFWH